MYFIIFSDQYVLLGPHASYVRIKNLCLLKNSLENITYVRQLHMCCLVKNENNYTHNILQIYVGF
jgi:hypothetical protein